MEAVNCIICKKGNIYKKDISIEWYECDFCLIDNNHLVDGFLYPLFRRGTLCSEYTPVRDLDVSLFTISEVVEFTTVKKTIKQAKVIHVDSKGNKMILEDLETGYVRLVIDYIEISDAYDDLFSENKVEYSGWWHRRIDFLK